MTRSRRPLEALGEVAEAQGRRERAARLSGAAAGLREAMGAPLAAGKPAAGGAGPGHGAFTAEWEEGRAMTFEDAVEYALEKPILF